jgi:hypothetical protein
MALNDLIASEAGTFLKRRRLRDGNKLFGISGDKK